MVAFLGMGLLGSNFTKAMLGRGLKVSVWNRTAAKALALEPFGAQIYEDIAEAVKAADTIHLTLKDDEAVNEVLARAKPGLKPGAIIIDHTTTSVNGAIERTTYWKNEGFTYLHAPVFMGPANALEGSGAMLVSGDQDVIAGVMQEISAMTGKVINFGNETGRAAGIKLIGNLFLVAMTGGIADMLALAQSTNVPISDISALFDAWNPGVSAPARLKKMTSNTFDQPSWELNMARKDARLMMEATEARGINLTVVPAMAALMDSWIARGFGNYDWTVVGKDFVD